MYEGMGYEYRLHMTEETIIEVEMNVENIQKEDHPGTMSTFRYRGYTWCCSVHRDKEKNIQDYTVSVSLSLDSVAFMRNLKNLGEIDYTMRIVNGDRVQECPSQKPGQHDNIMLWDKLYDDFFVDYAFKIQIKFQPPRPAIVRNLPTTLANALFTDVVVTAKKSKTKIACNKCVIAQASEAMNKAFSNSNSVESKTGEFNIGHSCATATNVHLLVQSFYEGWIPDLMDAHAKDLLILSDCYDAPQIADMAVDSLKRQVTAEAFWQTTSTAVLLQQQHPSLFEACLEFACAPNRLDAMSKRTEYRSQETIDVITDAVNALKNEQIGMYPHYPHESLNDEEEFGEY